MQQTNTNSNSNVAMNNGNQKASQWQLQQQQPLANYTLPGVINYLTSEFTDLERFKIMTNLEKSEMKYKIVQLQAELNSLRYINEKQKVRIDVLEKENQELRGQESMNGGESQPGAPKKEVNDSIDIPDIDLLEIQKSRAQMTKSMKQVLHLLKTPNANSINALNYPTDQLNEYEALINKDKIDNFVFADKHDENNKQSDKKIHKNSKDSIFSQYLNDIPFKNSKQSSSENLQDTDQSTASQIGDLNAKSIQYLTLSPEKKDPFPSASYKGEESDAETVIMDDPDSEKLELTKTRSNHEKDKSRDELENTTSTSLNSHYENKETIDEALSVKPNSSVTTTVPDYKHCRLFTNCLNDTLVYINYDHKSQQKLILLNVWSTLKNKLVVSKELSDSIIENPNNIIDVYCVSKDEETANVYLLIIYKSGAIDFIKLNENCDAKTSIINVGGTLLSSSKLIEFSHKSGPQARNYGLVVTGVLKAGSSPFIKIYNLLVDSSNSIVDSEIGSYVKSFFKLPNLEDSDTFEVVHWFKNDNTVVDTSSPQSSKGKSHKRTVSCTDVTLSPYEIILKLGPQLIRFNIVLKKYGLLLEELLGSFTQDVSFNHHLALFAEIKDDTCKLRVYDLAKKHFLSETSFANSSSENLSLILVRDQKEYAIARLDRTHIQFYDTNFAMLHHINISPLPNTLLYSNSNIILATMSKESIENLAIYDLNTISTL